MKFCATYILGLVTFVANAQTEFVSPLLNNPNIQATPTQMRSGESIDSTFVYHIDTLNLPVYDDFSVSRFEKYDANYIDPNVTSQQYFYLMNSTNDIPQNPTAIFCDSSHNRHETVSVVAGIPTTSIDYFSAAMPIWVNDLSLFPVQGEIKNVFQECYTLRDTVIDGIPDPDQDTIFYTSLPDYIQDSANVFFVDIDAQDRIWVDNYAYHNYTFSVAPWSLGVATLDGVDENGWPYDFDNLSAQGSADVLTSKPINLAGKTNVWLTFLYQAKGYGDDPEPNDSLILEWWLPDYNAWLPSTWWVVGNIPNDVWKLRHQAIPTLALDNGFRFRFRNVASTSGALDHWHIDYVILKDNQFAGDTIINDLAISEPIKSFLNTYTAVPWDHFQNTTSGDKMLTTLKVTAFNSATTPTNFDDGELEVTYSGILQGGGPFVLPNPGVAPGWTGNWEIGMNQYPYALSSNYIYDQSVTSNPQARFDVKLNIAAAVAGSNVYAENDTTYFSQRFDNYYAYDDGSAEAAYGITGDHALLAYKFTAYEEDTLTGILMHFVPSVNDVSDETFLLTIWDDNGGVPGNIIYQDDYFNTHSPIYSGGISAFKYYKFMNEQHVVVPQTFYVGWEQIESISLNVGMDRNINNGSKIYRNNTGTWLTSSFQGSLLIRPVFSTDLNYTLSKDQNQVEETEILVYPNPTENFISILGASGDFIVTVYDLSGRAVAQSENENRIDVSGLQTGIYLVNIEDQSGTSLFSGKIAKL
ncbi:MAG: T9SS type A sorting domain-containing protein [Bacteroidetes bacterium]|nr:T9SS type A sorting domain-containing protein [Bacteroidota bacterium]